MYIPILTLSLILGKKYEAPLSQNKPIAVSGMAYKVDSVAILKGAYYETPTPPPITIPFHKDI